MDISLTLSNRELKPAVVNCFQNENETTILKFTLDSYIYGEVDLRNYTPYAVTSINGQVDMTELESTIENGKLVLTWNVQEYSLRHEGAVCYQIVFKEDITDGENTAVFYSYKAILLNRASINADDHITANYPTILKQWLDRINQLSGTYDAEVIYMPEGETIPASERLAGRLYYQVENDTTYEGHFEDHLCNRLGEFNAKYVTNANLNTLVYNGDYICSGTLTNVPISSTYAMVRVTDSGRTNRLIQEVCVPSSDNTVRVFVRAVTGTNQFGEWKELVSPDYVNAKVGDKDFEIFALTMFHSRDLLDCYIETFENTDGLSYIPSGYDSRLHRFNITGDTYMIFKKVAYTDQAAFLWIWVDYDPISTGSGVTAEFSINYGSTWTDAYLDGNVIILPDANQEVIVKVNLWGTLTLKNVMFGIS